MASHTQRAKRSNGERSNDRRADAKKRRIDSAIDVKDVESEKKEEKLDLSKRHKITVVLQYTGLLLDRHNSKHSVSGVKLLHADSPVPSKQKDLTLPRPDITHQCLMMLLDSPLNKVGLLEILLENMDGKMIRVNPEFRIPRTWKVFAKVITDFLTNSKGELIAKDSTVPLLKLLEPSLSTHIDFTSSVVISLSSTGRVARLRSVLPRLMSSKLVFIIRTGEDRNVDSDPKPHHDLSVSNFPVATSVVCNKLCNEIEMALGI